MRFSTVHIYPGVAPKRELGDTDWERCASFAAKLCLLGRVLAKPARSPIVQSWLSKSAWQPTTGHPGSRAVLIQMATEQLLDKLL